ncbi:MAG: virulence RhuM family protein [Myxococcaceae bacterium]
MSNNEVILYTSHDGHTRLRLKASENTVWLSQADIAEIFGKGRSTIAEHISAIFKECELERNQVCRNFRQTAEDGKSYEVIHYNLDLILAVGYRTRSPRGIQFRSWATTTLREYLVKGFVLDNERLKNPTTWDYFDELLEQIREIRASEKRFYHKVRDIYATAIDYDSKSDQAQLFFKKVQNKMLWATTHHTAAELIVERADPTLSNMGLKTWKGGRVRLQDVTVAKNYLNQSEVDELNRIVVMYLDYAEDQARHRKALTMAEWEQKLDAFLVFNERELLDHAGKISAQVAEKLATKRYTEFDQKRQEDELLAAEIEDIALLESLQTKSSKSKKT